MSHSQFMLLILETVSSTEY